MPKARSLTKVEAIRKERLAASPKRSHPTDQMNIWDRAAWYREQAKLRGTRDVMDLPHRPERVDGVRPDA